MKVTCLYLELVEKRAQLYVAEISTAEALKIFPPSDAIQVTEFEAQVRKDNSWVSKKDLPTLNTVEEMIHYLSSSDTLELIDFAGTIGSKTEISTHDDGEAQFLVANEKSALDLLRRLIDVHLFKTIAETLLENKGKYIYPTYGHIEISDTFLGWDLSGG